MSNDAFVPGLYFLGVISVIYIQTSSLHKEQIMSFQKRNFLISGLAAIFFGVTLISGAFAQAPVSTDIAEKIVAAKTKADHELIAAEFDKQAEADKASAERHRKMGQAYITAPWAKTSGAGMVSHCKALVADYDKAAKQNTEMAKMHRELAAKLP